MDIYNMLKNIYGNNIEEQLIKSIFTVKEKLYGLTEERMCKIYNGYLLNELHNNHVLARMINTLDLELNYEHIFILVPSNDSNYFLVDLTFSQFNQKNDQLSQLVDLGYQLINDSSLINYLNIVAKEKQIYKYSLEDLFYLIPVKKSKHK